MGRRPRRRDPSRARQGHPGADRAGRHEVRQARAHPERTAVEVLGPRHVPRRARPPARGLRHAPERALPAHHQPRPLPQRSRQLAGDAAGPQPEVRVQRALSARVLQPHPAAGGLRLLQGVDRAELSACAGHRDPARQSLLRRLVRRELGQPGPVRRRDHEGARAAHRVTVPRHRRGLGARHLWRIDRRLGSAGRADVLPRRLQRRLRRVPGPDRLSRLHRRRHLQGRERLLGRGSVHESGRARATATTSATSRRRSSR